MKIAVCGKGGTGKSTMVALFAGEFKKSGLQVTVIDSDESNSGLFWMLGLERQPKPLMDFLGGRKGLQDRMDAKFKDGQSEQEMSIFLQDTIPMEDIPEDYRVENGRIRLIAIGKIKQSLEGCACPMGILCREFLKKLRLGDKEIAIVDMEAGIEHFGRGVENSVDAVVAVIEPSLESINLAQKIADLASGSGAKFAGIVMNKVGSAKTYETVSAELDKRNLPVLGQVVFNPEIADACLQGEPIEPALSGGQTGKIMEKLQTVLLPTNSTSSQTG